MRLFVIDNYDSFTYNIVQYFGELGAEQEVVRNDAIDIDDLKLDGFDGLVVSPGPCDPDKAGISLEAIESVEFEIINANGVRLTGVLGRPLEEGFSLPSVRWLRD